MQPLTPEKRALRAVESAEPLLGQDEKAKEPVGEVGSETGAVMTETALKGVAGQAEDLRQQIAGAPEGSGGVVADSEQAAATMLLFPDQEQRQAFAGQQPSQQVMTLLHNNKVVREPGVTIQVLESMARAA